MASIRLVVPTWHYWVDPLKLQPLWELYYATILREAFPRHDVGLIDMRGPKSQDTMGSFPESDIYVYWINKAADAFEVYDVIGEIRALYPRAIHVAGGTHVDHMPEQCAEHLDVILRGTAEDTMVLAVQDILDRKMPKKIYLSVQNCHFNKYPTISRDFIPVDRVVNDKHFQMYGGIPGSGAYFSRGCSFRCNFCVYNNPPKFEYRTGTQIRQEVEYLKREYGVRGVNLRDEVCIPTNKNVAMEYLTAIGDSDIIWRGQSVPLGSEEMVRLAAESGLQEVALGLESVDSDEVIKMANKPSKSIESNKRYIELLKKYGIKVKVCLILGLPGESSKVVDRTIAFLEEVEPDFVAVSGLDPLPGSTFYNNQEKYGIKHVDSDLSKHAHLIYRFGNEEEVGLPFEFEENASWGKSLSREEIANNIKTVQAYLRDHGMSY